MTPIVYVTDHEYSRIIGKAFAKGADAYVSHINDFSENETGPAIFYGILRGCGDAMHRCRAVGRDYFHIDLGYYRRGHFTGYYRITKNAPQVDGSGTRPKNRRIMQDWRRAKNPHIWTRAAHSPIALVPPSPPFSDFLGLDRSDWIDTTIDTLQRHSDRQIVLCEKGVRSVAEVMPAAHALVTHCSNAAVEAVLHGVPVIADGPSAVQPIADLDFACIEMLNEPSEDDVDQWMSNLAYGQFTIGEMRDGTAWEILNV